MMGSETSNFEDRSSDSPYVERVWRSHSERAGIFHSMATCHWVMVVTRHKGATFLTVRGPESKATVAECPAEGVWVGIHFKLGTCMPLMPNGELRDRNGLTLPVASGRAFRLNGSAWEYPNYDNAETFVKRLVKQGLIVVDTSVQNALRGRPELPEKLSQRTEQRHFLRTTGLTRTSIRQIERAREATILLRGGVTAVNVAHDLGYFDQAHLTRSLSHFVGQTPGQIARAENQLSFLYKTGER
jgi:Helix-turn-helix domain